jgi:hypothetical protein
VEFEGRGGGGEGEGGLPDSGLGVAVWFFSCSTIQCALGLLVVGLFEVWK